MKLRVVWVGKTKNPQLAQLCEEYAGRIKHFLPLEIAEARKDRLDSALDPSDRVVLLDAKGKPWTSDQFAAFLQQHMASDSRRLTFVIGDFDGAPASVKKRADVLWSLSPMTFTHDLSRVLLLEQIYRAFAIIHKLPYAK